MAIYDERRLHSVDIGAFVPQNTDQGPLVSVRVSINVTSLDGAGMGPGIDVELGVPADLNASLQEIQDQAVERAHALLQRVAREKLEDLVAASRKPPEFDFTKR